MKRCLFNGSPRGKNSNSRLIIEWVSEGITQFENCSNPEENSIQIVDLFRTRETAVHIEALLEADELIFVMPLYTDSMSGIVKHFIDAMAEIPAASLAGKKAGFIIQSGFPESVHSENLAAYLQRLCVRLNWEHSGTIIRGGSEGLRLMPEKMTAGVRKLFIEAGGSFAAEGRFNDKMIRKLTTPRYMTPARLFMFRLMSITGLHNSYWNAMLKKHNAYSRRFDAPYGKAFGAKN